MVPTACLRGSARSVGLSGRMNALSTEPKDQVQGRLENQDANSVLGRDEEASSVGFEAAFESNRTFLSPVVLEPRT